MDSLRDEIRAAVVYTCEDAGESADDLTDEIMAIPELQRIIAIAKDYDAARLGHTT